MKNCNIGIDIGFGDVKVFGQGIQKKFPSAIAYAKDGMADVDDYELETYDYHDRKYIVGQDALFSLDTFSTRDIEFLFRYAPLLLHYGLKNIDATNISTGLPLSYFSRHGEFQKVTSRITVNGITKDYSVRVFPQGVGILLDYRIDHGGKEIKGTDQELLVLDVGFNTVDIVVTHKGRAIKSECSMIERGGISKICQDLAIYLQNEMTINLSEQETKDILLRGKLKIYGNEKDLTTVIRDITEGYVDWLMGNLKSRYEERIKRVDKLIIAGGGAYYIHGHIPDRYLNIIDIPVDPEFANARGFYKASLMAEE